MQKEKEKGAKSKRKTEGKKKFFGNPSLKQRRQAKIQYATKRKGNEKHREKFRILKGNMKMRYKGEEVEVFLWLLG